VTNDEMERAIDFLLKSQANFDTQLTQTNEQLRQLTEQVSAIAGTQNQLIQVVTHTFEAQVQINESLRAGLNELAAKQSRTEEALTQLAEAQAHTERRLDALIDIVQRDRNGQ
jgi:chromosome segregation ATPase